MHRSLHICPSTHTWPTGLHDDIRAVLESAAAEIWQHCPNTTMDPIVAHYRPEGPITHFKRDEWARIVIGLNATKTFWCQYAYQFSHEFCHALAMQSNVHGSHWHELKHSNHWVEEGICEAASLFALRSMSKSWRTTPPRSNWASYADSLWAYAQAMLDDPKRQVPTGVAFLDWFAKSEPEMRSNSLLREQNNIVASRLLSLFEDCPSGWEAVTFINLVPRIVDKSLAQQLTDWHSACPESHKTFVVKFGAQFGIQL
jgi:hypothetical protein